VEVCALSALCALCVEVCALSALCALCVEVCALSALCVEVALMRHKPLEWGMPAPWEESRSISQPFRAGLTFGSRPSGPGILGDFAVPFLSPLLPQASWLLHGMAGQAG
jgi:hypothetical protein